MSEPLVTQAQIDVNASRTTLRDFKDLIAKDGGRFQFLREFIQNALEAEATEVILTHEPEAWEKYRVSRSVFLDNGKGFLGGVGEGGNLFSKMLNNSDSGKSTEGDHANFGVGAKISSRGFNMLSIVILSWDRHNPEGLMVRIGYAKDRNGDECFGFLRPDPIVAHSYVGTGTVTKPFYSKSLLVDFRKTVATLKREFGNESNGLATKGTAVILCGNHVFDSTHLKDAGGTAHPPAEFCDYINQRFFQILDHKGNDARVMRYTPRFPERKGGSARYYQNGLVVFQKELESRYNSLCAELAETQPEYDDDEEYDEDINGLDVEQEDFYSDYYENFTAPAVTPSKEFPTAEEVEACKTLSELAGLSRRAWDAIRAANAEEGEAAEIKESVKDNPAFSDQRLRGLKFLLEDTSSGGVKLCDAKGVFSVDGYQFYWYILNQSISISSNKVKADAAKGGVSVLYKNELYNKAAKPNLSYWGFPALISASNDKGTDLQDRVKIFVTYPSLPDDGADSLHKGGVRPTKCRTSMVWADTDGTQEFQRFPWKYAYERFQTATPTELQDLVKSYYSTSDDDDVSDILKSMMPYWNVVKANSAADGEKTACTGCGNTYRCTCKCSRCGEDKSACLCVRITRTCSKCGEDMDTCRKNALPTCKSTTVRPPKPKKFSIDGVKVMWEEWVPSEEEAKKKKNPQPKWAVTQASKLSNGTNTYILTAYQNTTYFRSAEAPFAPYYDSSEDTQNVLRGAVKVAFERRIKAKVVATICDVSSQGAQGSEFDLLTASHLHSSMYVDSYLIKEIEEELAKNPAPEMSKALRSYRKSVAVLAKESKKRARSGQTDDELFIEAESND